MRTATIAFVVLSLLAWRTLPGMTESQAAARGEESGDEQETALAFLPLADLDEEEREHFGARAVSRHEITVAQFRKFADATGHVTEAERRGGWGIDARNRTLAMSRDYSWRRTGDREDENFPAFNITRKDAEAYCQWLSSTTGRKHRLPSAGEAAFLSRPATISKTALADSSAQWNLFVLRASKLTSAQAGASETSDEGVPESTARRLRAVRAVQAASGLLNFGDDPRGAAGFRVIRER
ncbi:MAG TPA: SUMF1/EgtB/PvdO family nonheme iron enzyme [Planctomycetia bacterium]|nr:SUMF1/EgtB/PvdO family nonheme iron enzyme [Planctomycetia bacterium]